jgi:hypothetical protein
MDDAVRFAEWWWRKSSASEKAAFLSRMTQVLQNMNKQYGPSDRSKLEKTLKEAFSSYALYWGHLSILFRNLPRLLARLFMLEKKSLQEFDENEISKIVSPEAIIDHRQIRHISSRIIGTQGF